MKSFRILVVLFNVFSQIPDNTRAVQPIHRNGGMEDKLVRLYVAIKYSVAWLSAPA